ncbi:hypothetical protein [Micromonospora sp. NPDC004704]
MLVIIEIRSVQRRIWELTIAGSGHRCLRAAARPSPIVQLGDRYRLSSWVRLFGRGPEALTEFDSGHPIEHTLSHGVVTVLEPVTDPLGRYLVLAAGRRPGARLLVHVTSWTDTSFGQSSAWSTGSGSGAPSRT